MSKILTKSALLLFAQFVSCVAFATVTIETVPVGDVGNPNDPLTGNLYGGVSYAYNIDKYELTFAQYSEFLNAVAKTDPKTLWNPSFASITTAPHIARSGSAGSYTYSVVGSPNQPVEMNYDSAARFVNWLDNGQPVTGVEDATTTEDGAYTIPANNVSFQLLGINRNANYKWYIPSESEWYKAAYYQPASKGRDSDGYWAYPMRTNSIPYSAMPPGTLAPDQTKAGNFYENDFTANGYNDGYAATGTNTLVNNQDFLTDVGSYGSSPGYYGTYDQGGNAFEWTEGLDVQSFCTFRSERGGDAFGQSGYSYLQSSSRADFRSVGGYVGLRLVSIAPVPEPPTTTLLLLGMLGCGWRRWR